MHKCNRRYHLHNCHRKCPLHSSNRICHLQNWLQNLSLAEMVSPQIFLITIKKSSKYVSTTFKANSFSPPCITEWRNSTVHCVNEFCHILIISIFNFLISIHFTNQIKLKPNLAQKIKLIFKLSTIKER